MLRRTTFLYEQSQPCHACQESSLIKRLTYLGQTTDVYSYISNVDSQPFGRAERHLMSSFTFVFSIRHEPYNTTYLSKCFYFENHCSHHRVPLQTYYEHALVALQYQAEPYTCSRSHSTDCTVDGDPSDLGSERVIHPLFMIINQPRQTGLL